MRKLNNDFADLEAKVNEMNKEFRDSVDTKEEIQVNLENNKLKLVRAKRLINGLKEESERWKFEIKKLNQG